ncbi:hypothetical protein WDW37_15575 [Bdellovibrionota bacterium FG-1]
MRKLAFLALLCFSAPVLADERIEIPSFWLSRGYLRVQPRGARVLALNGQDEHPTWPAHSLDWPVKFQDATHSIGNSMLEFQSYGDGPYFHGGCDLRVAAREAVRAPVAGKIEAGHYGYSNNPDGSMEKFWYPWPKEGDQTYFEVAVVTVDGYRFEFHHIDETKLSPEVLKILQDGQGGKISAGAWLGNTIVWPGGVYHHTHYNVITPSGVRLNPEYYSPLLDDHQKPQVEVILASFSGGDTQDFGRGEFKQAPEFFAVAVIDRQDGNVYDHPPVYAGIRFDSGQSFAWDFRERLQAPGGGWPSIWNFFVRMIRGPDGRHYRTEGGYGEGTSVLRIPVPQSARGKFTLEIGDQAGNAVEYFGRIE